MHEEQVHKENHKPITKTNRVLGINVGYNRINSIGNNPLSNSRLHDEAQIQQGDKLKLIKRLKPIAAQLNELRIKAYSKVDREAPNLTPEQIYALIIEFNAVIERLVYWLVVKLSNNESGKT